jgi:hypothetical protein
VTSEMDVTNALPAATCGAAVLLCAQDVAQLVDLRSMLTAGRSQLKKVTSPAAGSLTVGCGSN